MTWKLIFNPFSKFSEIQLLIFGIVATFFGSFSGYFFNLTYDGVTGIHLAKNTSFLQSLKENTINILSVAVLLFITGKIIYRKTRIIDILNTALVSRFSIYISGLFTTIPALERISNDILRNIQHPENLQITPLDLSILLIISFLMLFFLVYFVILLVNGFKISTNAKKWQHFVFFTVMLILAEILSRRLIHSIF
jgi:hypothetical protein